MPFGVVLIDAKYPSFVNCQLSLRVSLLREPTCGQHDCQNTGKLFVSHKSERIGLVWGNNVRAFAGHSQDEHKTPASNTTTLHLHRPVRTYRPNVLGGRGRPLHYDRTHWEQYAIGVVQP